MGIFGDILSPLKDIIHGLEYPVEEVQRIFGTLITITKDLIAELVQLVQNIENLFNVGTFTSIFVTPFQTAILTAVDGIDRITALIFNYGKEEFTDIKTELEDPIINAYGIVKSGISDLKAEYVKIINSITPVPTRILDSSTREVHVLLNHIDDDIGLIQQEIKSIFQVTSADATAIVRDFEHFASRGATALTVDVNRVGTIAVDDARDLLQSVENRFKNENSAVDALIAVMVVLAIGGIITLYLLTHSISLIVASVLLLLTIAFTILVG